MSRITKQKSFVLIKGSGAGRHCRFSHLTYASLRESVRTRDLSEEGHSAFMTCRHSGT